MQDKPKPSYEIDFQPVGRRVHAAGGTNLLDSARSAGVELVAICGGIGNCGTCKVRLMKGELSGLTLDEQANLTKEEIARGYRLGCQCTPLSDVIVDIPPESLTTMQRLQIEGLETPVAVDPLVRAVPFKIVPPDLRDLRSDLTRFREGLVEGGFSDLQVDEALLGALSTRLRISGWQGDAVIREGWVIDIVDSDPTLLGLAVDIGTTKVAAYLVDLMTGKTIAREGCMNPQIAYGEDVISRIHYCNQNPEGRETLQKVLIDSLNKLAEEMCASSGFRSEQVYEAVVVGNTAMHHLFAGLNVKQLGTSPYVASVSEPLELRAGRLGLKLNPAARVYLPPNIAGFVGADHISMLLASQIAETDAVTLALDIGTNTEISLKTGAKLLSCSCASGPAFEGAHISFGMRAAPGAIERVWIRENQIRIRTIGEQPAVGICGSGILDATGELLQAGAIDPRGNLREDHPLVDARDKKRQVVLSHKEGKDITVTRADINEVQLAKGAIRAGIEVLLKTAGLQATSIEDFIIAGAFGTYLSVESAVIVGMFPNLPANRFHQVGNAAGAGARQMLVSKKMRQKAARIAESIAYIELTTHKEFSQEFFKGIMFESQTTQQESI